MPTYGIGSLYFLNYTSTQQTFKIDLKIKSISAFLLQKVHTWTKWGEPIGLGVAWIKKLHNSKSS